VNERERCWNIVRLIYFDEAGTASEVQEPITVVASVIIHGDQQWGAIEQHLDWIIQNVVPEESRQSFRGFHAKELFSSGYPITDQWGRAKRWEVFTAFLETFNRFGELPIVWMGIERRLFRIKMAEIDPTADLTGPYLARQFAFAFCLQGTNEWFRSHAPDEKGICIAESTDWQLVQFMRQAHSSYRKVPMIAAMAETKLDHLIDAISFRDKYETLGVQLADACNLLIKRHEMGKTDSEPFYQMIRQSMVPGFVFPREYVPEQG
jgi:hypothetical protein